MLGCDAGLRKALREVDRGSPASSVPAVAKARGFAVYDVDDDGPIESLKYQLAWREERSGFRGEQEDGIPEPTISIRSASE